MALIDDVGRGPIAIDTAPFIYLIEESPTYLPLLEPLFSAIDRGQFVGVTSELTLLEVLVVPYRMGDQRLAHEYTSLLTESRNLVAIPLDRALLVETTRYRATTGFRTPDAIHLATAMHAGASCFVTNDRALARAPGVRVLVLDDYR